MHVGGLEAWNPETPELPTLLGPWLISPKPWNSVPIFTIVTPLGFFRMRGVTLPHPCYAITSIGGG